MRTIRVAPHQEVRGWYLIRISGKIAGSVVLPNALADMGMLPTKDDVLSALRELGVPLVGEYRVLGVRGGQSLKGGEV
jgi:hypothetical protein